MIKMPFLRPFYFHDTFTLQNLKKLAQKFLKYYYRIIVLEKIITIQAGAVAVASKTKPKRMRFSLVELRKMSTK